MQISKRLEMVAEMVTSGYTVADIGTDHGYIPIYLIQQGKIPRALAMDVNRGPLNKAEENIRLYGLEDKITTRLSDGLSAMAPGDAECIIIAGMGGGLTVRILTEGKQCLAQCKELILQPQSEIRAVRYFLEAGGYQIVREEMICEDGKYYPMMRAIKNSASDSKKMDDAALRYGPLLLQNHHPVLREFLIKEKKQYSKILQALKGNDSDAAKERQQEIQQELAVIETALERQERSNNL